MANAWPISACVHRGHRCGRDAPRPCCPQNRRAPAHNAYACIMTELHLAWCPEHVTDRTWPAAWHNYLGVTRWAAEDVGTALLNQFCRGVWIEDPDAWASLQGPVLFLANHQVAVESVMFVMAVSPFLSAPLHAISKPEHADSWIGELVGKMFSWPGVQAPEILFFYRRGDATGMRELMKRLRNAITMRHCGLLVHVAASRVLS